MIQGIDRKYDHCVSSAVLVWLEKMAQNLTSFRKKNLPNYCLKIEQEQQKCNSIDDNLYLKKKTAS